METLKRPLTSVLLVMWFLAGVVAVYSQKTPVGPPEVAQTLYSAWQSGNRARAKSVADSYAVEKLFGVRRRTMVFKGCYEREEGDVECVFDDDRHDIRLAMLVTVSEKHIHVTSLSFSSEAQ